MKPLENSQTADFDHPCKGCGTLIYQGRWNESTRTGYCADCRVLCPHCLDWMAGEPEVAFMGTRYHKACIDAAIEATANSTPLVMLDDKPGDGWDDVLSHPCVIVSLCVIIAVAVYAVYVFTT